jgi:RNA polymerase sigma-70 factor (ECF subfamily)
VDYSKLDDTTLITLVEREHAEALSVLYDRYSRLVFSLALHLLGDQATAEEVTLDVFTRVWEKAGTYRADKAKVSTWLASIARYHAIDILRRQGSRPERNSVAWTEVTTDVLFSADGPEEATELTLQRQRVRAAMAELPADQQQALALAYFNGLTHREIAEKLGEPLGTVKTRIRLAMQKLRQTLKDE